MKLSVIVPAYNAEKTIRQSLDSILAQTRPVDELIVINDGSTDGTEKILQEYRDAYPDCFRFRTVENGGQGRARNFGLEIARGDWLGFVDSDDWVQPEMYETLISAAEREGADIAVCDILRCFEDGSRDTLRAWREGSALAAAGSCCDKVFRRSLVSDLRFPEGLWYEDFAYSALALSRAGKLSRVPEPLYCYRIGHPSTMHNQNARKNLDLLAVLDLLHKPMLDAGRKDDYETLVLSHALLDAINRVQRQEGKEKFTVIKEIRDYVNRTIPDLSHCPAFRAESGKRRLVMWLNYHGLNRLSGALLKLKGGAG